jgi:hypothetical protein
MWAYSKDFDMGLPRDGTSDSNFDPQDIDPNSPQGQEINSILAPLDDSCED